MEYLFLPVWVLRNQPSLGRVDLGLALCDLFAYPMGIPKPWQFLILGAGTRGENAKNLSSELSDFN